MHDDNPRVGLEAIYAFGALAPTLSGARAAMRSVPPVQTSPACSASLDPYIRFAGVRVIGRLFEFRPNDQPVDETVGDTVVAAMNDGDQAVQAAAVQALGLMRYERGVRR